MAYLPPKLAESAAGSIGIPIPGGRFGSTHPPAEAAGELVYEGPNVMMGYAEEPADFAMGPTVDELRTGDLARRRDDGLYEIVGRSNRFAKIFGLRIDLDRVERLFADEGLTVRAVELRRAPRAVRARRPVRASRARARDVAVRAPAARDPRARHRGVPAHLERQARQRRTRASRRTARARGIRCASTPTCDARDDPVALRRAARATRCRRSTTRSPGLGGDSLSYVEVSLRLEQLLGALPRQWPTMTVRDLAGLRRRRPTATPASAAAPGVRSATAPVAGGRRRGTRRTTARVARRRRMPRLETPAVLRAIAIVLVVGTHAEPVRR